MARRCSPHRAKVHDIALNDVADSGSGSSDVLKHSDNSITKKLRSSQQQTKHMIASVGQVAVAVAVTIVALGIAVLATNPLSAHSDSGADATAAFLDWFDAAGGVRSERIRIAPFANMGNGILASQDIREHDQLLFVPMHIVICRETIAQAASEQLQPLFQQLADAPDEQLTAFVLLESLKPAHEPSRWHAYWQLLPQLDQAAAPLVFANASELAALQDTHMIAAARTEQQLATRALRRFSRLFAAALPPALERTDLALQYRWTRFLVSSRAFTVHGDRLLVPFGDVFNGQPHVRVRAAARGERFLAYHRVSARGVEILADRSVDAGAQVFEDYGDNSNYVYALHHGFVMASNPFDCAFMQLPRLEAIGAKSRGSEDDADVAELKRRALAHFRVENGPSVCIASDGSVALESRQLAQFYAAVALATPHEMRSACSQPRHYEQCFLSTAAALAVGAVPHSSMAVHRGSSTPFTALVRRAVQTQLETFATTRNEDEELLLRDALSLSAAMRTAIAFRSSRKQILHAALAALQPSTSSNNEYDRVTTAHNTLESQDEDDSAAARILRFERWIAQQHLPVNHLALRFVSNAMGYGTFATKALARGEPYVSVPTAIVMDMQSAAASSTLQQLVQRLGRLAVADDALLLTLHLLDEAFGPNSRASRWRAYVDVLPTVATLTTTSPLLYDDDDVHMALLQATDLYTSVRTYRSRVRHAYKTLQQHVVAATDRRNDDGDDDDPLTWLTESRFVWATAILDSRSIWWAGARHLVPLLDMVNCADLGVGHAPHTTDLDDALDSPPAAVTRASWDFATGEQVVENYGQPNHVYLLYHGFVLAHNKHDCAHVALTTADRSAVDALPMQRKRALMAKLEALALATWTPELCVDPFSPPSVARFAKVAMLTQMPLQALEVVDGGTAIAKTKTVTRLEAQAGLGVVAHRLTALNAGLQHSSDTVDSDAVASDHRVTMIRTYVQQQHALFTALQSALQTLEVAAQAVMN